MANPGQDQIAKWKAAIAAHHKQQRRERGNHRTSVVKDIGPGMVRRSPQHAQDGAQDGGDGADGDGPWHD